MRTFGKGRLLRSTVLAGFAASSIVGGAALAQDADDEDPEETEEEAAQEGEREQIRVTGSRISRDTFSSTRPLQVVEAETALSLGAIDAAQLIQQSTTVSGEQITDAINTSLSGSNAAEIPPEGGVGSQNVGLRGLSSERTLVLLNGRRLAPAGIGGAPTRPDLSTIPTAIVDRLEVLTGGASSIYGADAVGGVVNIITKQNFSGFEIDAFRSFPDVGAGEESRISLVMGADSDRGNVTMSAEFFERNAIRVSDLGGPLDTCLNDVRNILSEDDGSLDAGDTIAFTQTVCASFFPDNSMAIAATGDLFFWHPGVTDPFWSDSLLTPIGGATSSIIPDWSFRARALLDPAEQGTPFANFIWGFDTLPNGQTPEWARAGLEFGAYTDQDERQRGDFRQGVRRFSFSTTGEYELDVFGMTPTVFLESNYSNRQTRQRSVGEQVVAEVPGLIPVLNADATDYARDLGGDVIYVDNPLNPTPGYDAEVINIIDNDFDQVRDAELETIRITGGLRDEYDSLFGFGSNWQAEIFASYDRNLGYVGQDVLFRPAVFAGTQLVFQFDDGRIGCGIPSGFPSGLTDSSITLPSFNGSDILDPNKCTPIDWFNPIVLESGSFATQREADFVGAVRTNRTIVEQSVFGGFVSGDAFELPAGALSTAFGMEYRIDKLNSINDTTVIRGLQASEAVQSEGSAQGETWQRDIFAEFRIPILADVPFAEELTVEASVRHTEEKNFGGETTYSVLGLWRPFDWLMVRGDYNTAFRAPNLREQFIAQNASGTAPTAIDPCRVPGLARADTDNDGRPDTYDASEDTRDPNLLAQCVAAGVDPTALALLDSSSTSIPVFTSGNVNLKPETAETYSAGFVLTPDVEEIPIANHVLDGLSFAATYWNIEVADTVEELGAGSVVFGCYDGNTPTLESELCNRVERLDNGDPSSNALRSITIDFVNRGLIKTDGLDMNLRLSRDVSMFDQDITFVLDNTSSYIFSYKSQAQAGDPFDQDVGEDFRPRWQNNHTLSAFWEDWSFRWQARWTSQVGTGNRGSAFFNGFVGNSAWASLQDLTGYTGSTTVRTLEFIDEHWEHNLSASYNHDTWSFTAGVRNAADNRVRIDSTAGIGQRNGLVVGGRYDITGRTWFARVNKSF